ncbi:hypothetical protein PMAYCL1PPCAC_12504 [Pristionchus mayeri]|uniref:Uncharacterized protein n=1 Tax=Pristionchus mayeri TaxID=1317129 RepID=A0AAN4ZLZ5_9BILA|nr:hypothetical protein PMAYCL1PPCAC_12504 [Pristionchus mayeri]
MVVSIVGSIALFFIFALLYNLLVTPDWAVKDTPSLIAERAVTDVRSGWLFFSLRLSPFSRDSSSQSRAIPSPFSPHNG